MPRRALLFLPFLLVAVVPGRSTAQSAPEAAVPVAPALAQPGASVIAADWRTEILTQSKFGVAEASSTDAGIKLITTERPENVYELQAFLRNQVPVSKGDTLLFRFAARSLKSDVNSGVTKLKVGFSRSSPPWESSSDNEIGVGAKWERFDIPFTCQTDFAPEEAKLYFQFGYPLQTAEIADVQLLRYDASVRPDTLPKTARRADPVTPAALATEVARISRMRLDIPTAAVPTPGRTLYVTAGSPVGGDGSARRPFASIGAGTAAAQPGDTVLVAAGEYREPKGAAVAVSGRADAWIKIKAAPGPSRPKLISSNWHGFDVSAGKAYVEIEGFELDWTSDPSTVGENGAAVHGSGIALLYGSHHVRILNNVIHGYGTAGIASLDCDYLSIEGNRIYDCCKTSPYGGSAIAMNRAFDFDQSPGYHNVVRGNIIYDNELKVATNVDCGGDGRTITDGNGIIIDTFDRSRKNPLLPHDTDHDTSTIPYRGRTLVENNLVYNNGGRGIHAFRSSNVDVINNTCYMNQKSADINGGEFTGIEGEHLNFLNNIAYGRKEKRGNTQDGSSHVIWSHNLFYHVADVLLHDGLIQADPLFVAPGLNAKADGFRLQPTSPALGKGLTALVSVPGVGGKMRPASAPVDLGAFPLGK